MPHNTRYDDKLLRILESACRVFAEKGYHNASVRDVAAATGVSPAGLYYYFQSKEELLQIILENSLASLVDRIQRELSRVNDPAERLKTIVRTHLDQFKDNGRQMRVLVREWEALTGGFGHRIRSLMRTYVRIVMDTLKRLAPERENEEIRAAAFGLFGMLTWVDQWYRPGRDLPLDLVADQFSSILLGEFMSDGRDGRRRSGEEATASGREWGRKGARSSILSGPGF